MRSAAWMAAPMDVSVSATCDRVRPRGCRTRQSPSSDGAVAGSGSLVTRSADRGHLRIEHRAGERARSARSRRPVRDPARFDGSHEDVRERDHACRAGIGVAPQAVGRSGAVPAFEAVPDRGGDRRAHACPLGQLGGQDAGAHVALGIGPGVHDEGREVREQRAGNGRGQGVGLEPQIGCRVVDDGGAVARAAGQRRVVHLERPAQRGDRGPRRGLHRAGNPRPLG